MTRTTSDIILLLVDSFPLFEFRMTTPRYTVMSCFGSERRAARLNTMMPMPHVENTAVVTMIER